MYPENYPVEPKAMWQRFYDLTQVPRPSKKEEKVRAYLVNAAKEAKLKYRTDEVGNVVIYVPGTVGYEQNDTVILQSHMDMVCDKLPEKTFDFENDPIEVLIIDGWVRANGTTLGADNGFGCAVMLATMDDKTLKHPPLELFFTVDEETGLHGALNFDPDMLSGRRLINIDSEDWGDVYVGCAGGIDYKLRKEFKSQSQSGDYCTVRIDFDGLKGGHSGMDIIWGRGNAIKLVSTLLGRLQEHDARLVEFSGGRAHNIIPRDAYAVINIGKDKVDILKSIADGVVLDMNDILPDEDKNLSVSLTVLEAPILKSLSLEDTEDFIRTITLFPHGAHGFNWNADIPLVSSSNNLAICKLVGDELYIESSLRFFDRKEATLIEDKITVLGSEYGLDVKREGEYPSWKPIFDGELLDIVKAEYRESFGGEMKVKAIHAGLECGIIKDRLGDLDAISIGPNITGVHSPSEGVEIESSNQFWKLFSGLLARL